MIEQVALTSPFVDYQPLACAYDELHTASGQLRPHWKSLIEHLQQLGSGEVQRRWEIAQRQMRDVGVTFNPQDETGEGSRPWRLDAIPLLMPQADWQPIATGLEQRAALYEKLLDDLLGPQVLLREKIVPPNLLFAHPAFQPSYHGLPAPPGGRLIFYAADLTRGMDGQWWVSGDRSRAPTGLGYVLENRVVTSRMLPVAFRQNHVMRLARFFMSMRETLQKLAPRFRDNPRIVLWTPGTKSPSYFEDAYLSRYLNFTLVEGGDLAVRDQRVMLKTLGGLLPVEVIMRRVDEDLCDPVELDPNSMLGVSGLLEILRVGNVAIGNPLGSRLVESPVWLPFLPTICRRLLGEELKLPSIATWWCGQPDSLRYVLEHLDELVIRPAFRMDITTPIKPAELDAAAKSALVDRIRANPDRFVAQYPAIHSTSPAWNNRRVEPWYMTLRCFLVASEGKFTTMPGGLARTSVTPDDLEAIMTSGQRSQDVWILSDEPVEPITLLAPEGTSVTLHRSGAELPSRVADHMFWLGRNIERADGIARLLRTLFARLASDEEHDPAELAVLMRILAEHGLVEPGFVVEDLQRGMPNIESVLPGILFHEHEPGSLRSTVCNVVHLASVVRDRLSLDAWRIIHEVEETSQPPADLAKRIDATDVLEMLQNVIMQLAAFAGLASESMTRTLGWRFLELGRRIERTWHGATLLRSALCRRHADEQPVFEAVLETADSVMTYRSRYLANLQAPPMLDLLLTDETNPRSVAFQLVSAQDHITSMPRSAQQVMRTPEERLVLSMLNLVRLADVQELCQRDRRGDRPHLERLLARLLEQLPKLADTVSGRFLIHAGLPRHFGSSDPNL